MQKLSLWPLSAEIKDHEVEVGSLKQLPQKYTDKFMVQCVRGSQKVLERTQEQVCIHQCLAVFAINQYSLAVSVSEFI